jgi:hypothetical protein
MRTLSLFCAVAACAVSVAAHAAPCSTTISLGAQNEFIFNELGQAPYRKPVVQANSTFACGDWSYTMTNTLAASSKGRYWDRNYGDENDLTAAYDHTFQKSLVGPIEIQGSVAYWKYSPLSRSDANLVFSANIGRPFSVGAATLTPYIGGSQYVGIGFGPTVTTFHSGIRISASLSKHWSVQGDVGQVWNSFPHKYGEVTIGPVSSPLDLNVPVLHAVSYASGTITRDLGHDWSTSVNAMVMTGAPIGFGLTVQKKF